MIEAIFILLFVAGLANAIMDLEAFKPSQTIWHGWAQHDTRWGRFWARWSGRDSWRNKYLEELSPWRQLLRKTLFVWVTDLWHLAQRVFHTCWQAIGALALALYLGWGWWEVLICIGVQKLFFGVAFNLGYSFLFKRVTEQTMWEKLRIYFRDKLDEWGFIRFGLTFVWLPGLAMIFAGQIVDWLLGYTYFVEPEHLTPGDWVTLIGFGIFILFSFVMLGRKLLRGNRR